MSLHVPTQDQHYTHVVQQHNKAPSSATQDGSEQHNKARSSATQDGSCWCAQPAMPLCNETIREHGCSVGGGLGRLKIRGQTCGSNKTIREKMGCSVTAPKRTNATNYQKLPA